MNDSHRKNSILLFMLYAFLNAATAGYGPYLNLLYKSRGVTVALIGVLSTIAPLVSIIVAPLWGKAVDKSGNRRRYIIILVSGSMVAITLYLKANIFLHFAIINFIIAIFQTSISATVESLTLGIVERNGHNYSKIRLGGTVGYASVLLLLGNLFSKHFSWSIIFGVLSYLVMIGCVLALPKKETILPPSKRKKVKGDKLFKDKKTYIILAMLMFTFMTHSFNSAFISLYLQEVRDSGLLNILLFCGTISEFPILFFIQKIMNRFNTMHLLIFSGLVAVLRMVLISTGLLPLMFLGQFLQGPSYMLNFYCGTMLIYQLVPTNMKSQGQSAIAVVQGGIGSVLGNMGGGRLVTIFGFRSSYLIIGAINLIITGISYFFYKKGFDIETDSPTIS